MGSNKNPFRDSYFRGNEKRRHPQGKTDAPRRMTFQKRSVAVLLENGRSFEGTAVSSGKPYAAKCEVFFTGDDGKKLIIPVNTDIRAKGAEAAVKSGINRHLASLHEEAVLDFPEWLEKCNAKPAGGGTLFSLNDIKKEFRQKRRSFGFWRIAGRIGFFEGGTPQDSKLNKVMHVEIN